MTLFFISWFLVGVFSLVFFCINDMRGKEFNPNYFDHDDGLCFFMIFFGYISFIIVCIFLVYEKVYENKLLSKLIYKIANIGVKKQEKEET